VTAQRFVLSRQRALGFYCGVYDEGTPRAISWRTH
jgi:hypothetical protein